VDRWTWMSKRWKRLRKNFDKKICLEKIRKSDPKSRKSEVFPSENPIIRHPRFLKIRSENPIRTLANPNIRKAESEILINPIRKSDPRFSVHPLQPCFCGFIHCLKSATECLMSSCRALNPSPPILLPHYHWNIYRGGRGCHWRVFMSSFCFGSWHRHNHWALSLGN
jgi:hypothetical protein